MLFNSIDFAFFFPIVFLLYWLIFTKNNKLQNLFLLSVSYLFYGWWDWRFLSLIVISSAVDFFIGKMLQQEDVPSKRRVLLGASIVVNIGILAFFKYCNFFIDSFADAFSLFGANLDFARLDIILPVGISFYTFQTLSYTIDIYKKKIEPTEDALSFFAFVSFFPQLVAGPIERASHLLPQFQTKKTFSYEDTRSGLLLMAWGFFKKIVIADRLAVFVNAAYGDVGALSGIETVFAIIFFAFQLYLDFSAYSDIAIGCARTLGFKLSLNFNKPYLSSSFSDFWKRWHISLSSWFRDYVYIPLGGSKNGPNKTMANIFVVFLLSGLWHGASWNFVLWGALNGLFLIIFDRFLTARNPGLFKQISSGIFVSAMWALSLVFFRVHSFPDAITVLQNISFTWTDKLYTFGLKETEFKFTLFMLVFLMCYEFFMEKYKTLQESFYNWSFMARWPVYIVLVLSIVLLGAYGAGMNDNSFIYFQF